MDLEQINNFLSSTELNSALLPFKVVFILITIAFMILSAYYLIKQVFFLAEKNRIFKDFMRPSFDQSTYIYNRWKQILNFLAKKTDLDYKAAIMNMEGMLYDIFKALKYQGGDLKELLPEIREKNKFKGAETIEAIVYLSGKLKNDPTYRIDPEITEKLAIDIKDILTKLKIIN